MHDTMSISAKVPKVWDMWVYATPLKKQIHTHNGPSNVLLPGTGQVLFGLVRHLYWFIHIGYNFKQVFYLIQQRAQLVQPNGTYE